MTLLQMLAWIDIALSVLFILLCCLIAARTRVISTIPIALCGLALLLQYLFTAVHLPGWTESADLRMFWGYGFYALFIFFLCLHLVFILRRGR